MSHFEVKDGDKENNNEVTKHDPPSKAVWYLLIISRCKHMFANPTDAKNLRWHADERKCDGLVRHSADFVQWRNIDKEFPTFGNESRNLRLELASDGMNPYEDFSTNHSSWLVSLVIYNLPPSLCMKRKYMMLSIMISGPKKPGNDIDVYLSPLIEGLKFYVMIRLKSLMGLPTNPSKCMTCYFVLSMTFLHMEICQVIV